MSKKTLIILCAIIIIIVAALGWWSFSRTNSVVRQTNSKITNAKSSEKSITSFTFSGLDSKVSQAINNVSHTVTLVVPSKTDVKNLTPEISVSDNAIVSPASGVVQDFAKPVTYTITAQDGSIQNYVVTVKIATPQGVGGS